MIISLISFLHIFFILVKEFFICIICSAIKVVSHLPFVFFYIQSKNFNLLRLLFMIYKINILGISIHRFWGLFCFLAANASAELKKKFHERIWGENVEQLIKNCAHCLGLFIKTKRLIRHFRSRAPQTTLMHRSIYQIIP